MKSRIWIWCHIFYPVIHVVPWYFTWQKQELSVTEYWTLCESSHFLHKTFLLGDSFHSNFQITKLRRLWINDLVKLIDWVSGRAGLEPSSHWPWPYLVTSCCSVFFQHLKLYIDLDLFMNSSFAFYCGTLSRVERRTRFCGKEKLEFIHHSFFLTHCKTLYYFFL